MARPDPRPTGQAGHRKDQKRGNPIINSDLGRVCMVKTTVDQCVRPNDPQERQKDQCAAMGAESFYHIAPITPQDRRQHQCRDCPAGTIEPQRIGDIMHGAGDDEIGRP